MFFITCSQIGLTVQPQDIAVPISMITNSSDGGLVLSFYVQLGSDSFVASTVLTMAIGVCC